ncbi:MAG TPA: hypothetical protein VGA67_05670 [Candidatus Dojkabacteria bacterium]|jgi:hypothetical protein
MDKIDTTNPPYMACGHRANSLGKKAGDNELGWACVICSCFDVIEKPHLEGRRARCTSYGRPWGRDFHCIYINDKRTDVNSCRSKETICNCERPSDEFLPFFEYRGKGSKYAKQHCANCRYVEIAHIKKQKEFFVPKHSSKICDNFTPVGPQEFDAFYCGCSVGWD